MIYDQCHFCGRAAFPIHPDSIDQYGEPVCVPCYRGSLTTDGINDSAYPRPNADGACVPVTTVDLRDDTTDLATTGHTIAVELPSGYVLDLWIYEDHSTTSVDVRSRADIATVNGSRADLLPLRKVIHDPRSPVVAVVIR